MLYAPAPHPVPAMSISVTDGQDTARSGARLGYVLTVRNEGAADLKGLRLEQRIPSPARGLTADQGGLVRDGVVSWTVDVPAHGEQRLRVRALVGRTASSDTEQSRLASTACAFLAHAVAPAVCATDMDALAASAVAVRAGGSAATTRVGIAAALAAAVGGALLVLRQRSRRFGTSAAGGAEAEDRAA